MLISKGEKSFIGSQTDVEWGKYFFLGNKEERNKRSKQTLAIFPISFRMAMDTGRIFASEVKAEVNIEELGR